MPDALIAALGRITAESKDVTPILEACIRETLRYIPSVPRVGRKATEDVELRVPVASMVGSTAKADKDGFAHITIPAGMTVAVDITALHRHSCWGPDRHEFNPGRFLDESGAYVPEDIPGMAWTPFAAGNRKCIGYNLALMEARGILAAMILLAEWECPPDDKHLGTMAIVCRPAAGLPVTLTPRAGVSLPSTVRK